MNIPQLIDQHWFPNPMKTDPEGLLAWGGDLHPDRLLLAYRQGIFPWFNEGSPPLWWCPVKRFVLPADELRIPRSLRPLLKQSRFTWTKDQAFERVLQGCAGSHRKGQDGTTWLSPLLQQSLLELHRRRIAHSIEVWEGNTLAGGLYGLQIGRLFCGESMFTLAPNASKFAFVQLVQGLAESGVPLIDCQMPSEHLARFGAREISRKEFLHHARALRDQPPPAWWGL